MARREGVNLPEVLNYCHQCGTETQTVLKHMTAGIGNACSECGAFRKGKPYVSQNEFKTLTRDCAKGDYEKKQSIIPIINR